MDARIAQSSHQTLCATEILEMNRNTTNGKVMAERIMPDRKSSSLRDSWGTPAQTSFRAFAMEASKGTELTLTYMWQKGGLAYNIGS